MFSFLQHVISLAVLYLYPSYRSYKALNNKNVADAQEWLCYWIVAGILTVPLMISNSILNWFPFYYEIKLIFCLWLILPQTKGHLALYDKYVIPYMNRFSGRIDNYARDLTDMSKKYAGVAWQKGLEIAQTKFFEVLAKGPSALFDFSNISLNFGNIQNTDNGRIREINDDEESFNGDSDFDQKNMSKPNQMIIKKKRSNQSNSNVKSFNIGLNRNNVRNNDAKKRGNSKINNEFNTMDRDNLQQTSSFKRGGNKRVSTNSPYSQQYSMEYDDEIDDYENDINYNDNLNSGKGGNNLFMNIMSNHRPGPGGMMGINDVYSSESDDLHSNNSNSNDGNYYEDEDIEENYNYNTNNVYYGNDKNKNLSKVNQRSMRDNYYDYDYDLTREDDDTITGNDLYNNSNGYSGNQKRKINSKGINENKNSDLNYQQSFMFNSFFH